MMEILHIVPAAPFGGAQKLAIELAAKQRDNGDLVRVILVADSMNCASTAISAASDAQVRALLLCGNQLAIVRKLRRQLAKLHYGVVHLHVPPPWLVGAFLGKREYALVSHLHTRPLLTVHEATIKRRLDSIATGMIMRRCDRTIAISRWIASAWRDKEPEIDPTVIYNGIPLPASPIAPSFSEGSRNFTLGMASRLSDRKGVEEFLELAAILHERAPDIRFRIAGDGPMRKSYEQQARALGLGDCLVFEGFVDAMDRFWPKLDVAVFTPPFEPFGLRLIEPVVGGVPVIGYQTGTGADEVMDMCRGTSAVPYGNAKALSELAISLMRHPAQRASMVKDGAQDIAERFSLERMSGDIDQLYAQAIEARNLTSRPFVQGEAQ